jgi:hypothetical protein
MPNQSVVGPRSRSKSSADIGPSARIRSSTRSAISAFSSRTCGELRLRVARNQANSLAGTSESPFELDRAELAEDVEHGVGAPRERPRRREEVPGDEKTARPRR